ncbi:thioredoxin 1 [Glycomyces sambucus]|uniref:Thioredoxin 1 n=1 Tax=Glycomyces sambucus TaxID=380244 RepID=A0A1G9CHG6_9ACTN|nr:thioredoxin domain-containing protein [Glycomyces sambucus]SDK51016.1 thioredoxin 1 [Glycomyces sambucus]
MPVKQFPDLQEATVVTASTMPEVSEAEFAGSVLASEGPVLVEFSATWCGTCRRMASLLDRLAADRSGEVRFVKVNADESPDLVAEYGVTSTRR